ncbi:MAG TPA: hypothetical protein VI413_07940 [Paludibacter sp.]
MKKISIVLILLFVNGLISAQISTIRPTSTSIANTSVADTKNWMAFDNPAMLGYVDRAEVGTQFENRYLISELSTKSCQVGIPSKLLNTGLSFSHFGYSLYHEMMVGLGFARNFSDKFALGMQFNYYTAFFAASNSYRGVFLPQIGFSAKLSPNFSLGFHSFNPFQTNMKTEFATKRLPSVFSMGTQYFFSPELAWRTQIDKEVSSNYRFATGFEYQMIEQLSVKMGAYGSDYLVPCLGFGFNSGSVAVNLNCELHPVLGLNTLAAIKYRFSARR